VAATSRRSLVGRELITRLAMLTGLHHLGVVCPRDVHLWVVRSVSVAGEIPAAVVSLTTPGVR